jgi:hypothetical protein
MPSTLWITGGGAYGGQDAVVGIVEDKNQYSFVP